MNNTTISIFSKCYDSSKVTSLNQEMEWIFNFFGSFPLGDDISFKIIGIFSKTNFILNVTTYDLCFILCLKCFV